MEITSYRTHSVLALKNSSTLSSLVVFASSFSLYNQPSRPYNKDGFMEDMNRDKWSARTSPLKLLDTMVLFTLSACRISDIFSFFVGVEWLDGGGDDGLLAVTTSAFGGGGGDFGEILSGF
jgi:hypothetical protein